MSFLYLLLIFDRWPLSIIIDIVYKFHSTIDMSRFHELYLWFGIRVSCSERNTLRAGSRRTKRYTCIE